MHAGECDVRPSAGKGLRLMRRVGEVQIHWFSIFNSSMILIFLTGLVAMILMRTLRADYARYTARDEDDLEVPRAFPPQLCTAYYSAPHMCVRQWTVWLQAMPLQR